MEATIPNRNWCRNYVENLVYYINWGWVGCYLNGNLLKSDEENKNIKEEKIVEYSEFNAKEIFKIEVILNNRLL